MRVVMLSWSYWPGHEGGAERQCRKVIEELGPSGIYFYVLTSLFSSKANLREDLYSGEIVRLGAFVSIEVKLRKKLQKAIRFVLGHLFLNIETDRRAQAILFWLMLPFVWLSRASFIFALYRWFLKNSDTIDVIHVHEADWLAGVAAWIGTRHNIPVLAKTATAPALPKIGYDVPWRGRWHCLRMHCLFIAQHQELIEELVRCGIERERIFLLPNGVKIPDTIANPERWSPVLYVGNFSQGSHRKAFGILIQAWAQVSRRIPTARLDMLGGGDDSQWRRLAEELNCLHSMRFHGSVPDPSPYYKNSCLFLLPSRLEGISNALLEAQSYGLPCVVSNISGNLAVVQDGVNGLVVPVNDVDAFAEATIRLLEDHKLRFELGLRARQTAEERFSLLFVSKLLAQIYWKASEQKAKIVTY